MTYRKLYEKIRSNKELQDRMLLGFLNGEKRGKRTDVGEPIIKYSLVKQWEDLIGARMLWLAAKLKGIDDPKYLDDYKQKIADLINVAGVLFLEMQEYDKNGDTCSQM